MTDERVVIERTAYIEAPPESVFAFLIDPKLMAQWFGSLPTLDPQPGGVFRMDFNNGHVALGVFTEIKPHHRVVFTWGWESAVSALASMKPGCSIVEIDLEAQAGGTRLRLRHSGLPAEFAGIHGDEWSGYLRRLAAKFGPSHLSEHQRL
jgi:uncharacterized protein YndB with AHSA1/START domain